MPSLGRPPTVVWLVLLSLGLAAGSCDFSARAAPPPAHTPAAALRNVMYVMVDDLRSQLSCYGHNDTVRTPNVDRLAASGTLFRHAYVSIAVCSPSRSSFLTGLRPQQQNVLNFRTDFRRATPAGGEIVALPQWFKATGYTVSGMGKSEWWRSPVCSFSALVPCSLWSAARPGHDVRWFLSSHLVAVLKISVAYLTTGRVESLWRRSVSPESSAQLR
jgi:hypothetical protein